MPTNQGSVATFSVVPFLLALFIVPPASLAATGPSLQLFPTTVLEDIKETGEAAQELESGLQDVIARMDQQQSLYVESKCEGADGDPGCQNMAQQLGATYLEMLNIMSDQLPDMELAVNNTRDSLQKRLRKELGMKMTTWDMQEMLLGKNSGKTDVQRSALRGRSGMRLSDRFSRYYKLVAHSGNTSSHSLAVIAADIYLDMDEASDLIAKTRDEINRATLMEQLNQSFGQLTPDMEQVVDGVKSILFGASDQEAQLATAPLPDAEPPYRSPLAM